MKVKISLTFALILYTLCSDIPDNFDESSLGLLTRKLNDIAHKYSMFGTMLDISYADIAAIENRVINVREYLRQMLGIWSERGGSPSDIITAIRSPTIGYMALAKKLEEEWTENGFCKSQPMI